MSASPLAVRVFPNEMEARAWAGVLEAAGIPTMVRAEGAGYGLWGHDSFLPHALYVRPDERERAEALLPPQERVP